MSIKGSILKCVVLGAFALSASVQPLTAQNVQDEEEEDYDDSEVRENPVIENDDEDAGITVPGFIKTEKNRIAFNGADWSSVRRGIENCRKVPFSIVHIGDSHLQADIATGVTREYLQYDYGNAGRGLVVPFRMAGTNEPYDYYMKGESGSWLSSKLLKRPWIAPMGFTGIAVKPTGNNGEIYVGTSEKEDYNPFISLTIYSQGGLTITGVKDKEGEGIDYKVAYEGKRAIVTLGKEQTGVYISFTLAEDSSINGIRLSGNRPGVFYNVIGNNGATYQTYNAVPNFGRGVSLVNPGLIIISLGTNEAFGTFSVSVLKSQIRQLVDRIKRTNPGVPILLVTPMECQRSVYSTTTKKIQKKGKRGKSRSRSSSRRVRVRGYGVNTNVEKVRNAILEFGRENKIATYDWFDVAGGNGASTIWLNEKLYGRDRVHHTARGYRLQGYLLYEALKSAIE